MCHSLLTTIALPSSQEGFEVAKFLKEEVEPVLAKEEPKFAQWAQQFN